MSVLRRNKDVLFAFTRFVRTKAHSSSQLGSTEAFVGPPDPISNIRPVLRANLTELGLQRAHPYSLSEFSRQEVVGYSASSLHERHIEAFNHSFWTDVGPINSQKKRLNYSLLQVNTRFNAARQKILDSHPPVGPGKDTSARDAALEADLAAFYRSWLAEEDSRFRAYILRYYVEQVRGIWLVFRSYWSS
ncbi:unnamed protein product [Rhizoctonia solani]|uniref:Uncharacterized protein n=1 Tax=Rhizoctonia solani TaxID=456999 RepID=A0A8H3HIP8_9AGAM|nr:unnamed protein product [Rhizoctonia solani]